MISTEETLYIKILIWAYEKADAGFTKKELQDFFNLDDKQIDWQLRLFEPLNFNERLISRYQNREESDLFALTDKGMAAAVRYIELKNTVEGSKRAEKIAKVAIGIGIIVGVVEIIVSLLQLKF